jgi:hypothetical protein
MICAVDADRNVRWPAISLLGRSGLRTQSALDVLVRALDDPDVEVRLQAAAALSEWGPMARTAIQSLAARLRDPEFQVAHVSDLALWQIDQEDPGPAKFARTEIHRRARPSASSYKV